MFPLVSFDLRGVSGATLPELARNSGNFFIKTIHLGGSFSVYFPMGLLPAVVHSSLS